MQFTTLTGDDTSKIAEVRRGLLDAAGGMGESIECGEDEGAALWDAIAAPSLFGGARVVGAESVEKISAEWAERILQAGAVSDAVVVGRVFSTPTPGQRAILTRLGEVKSHGVPKGKGVRMSVEEALRSGGVRAGGDVVRFLSERLAEDPDRVRSIVRQLQMSGLLTPSLRQVELLAGSSESGGVPWDVSDALERGDAVGALLAAKKLEGVAVVVYLQNRMRQVGVLVEKGVSDPDVAMKELSLSHRFQAEKLVGVAKKLDRERVKRVHTLLLSAERDVKLRREEGVLDWYLLELSGVLRGR